MHYICESGHHGTEKSAKAKEALGWYWSLGIVKWSRQGVTGS